MFQAVLLSNATNFETQILSTYKPWPGYGGMGERGWCSGESTHLPPMWPGFVSRTRRHMWVEFVVGSRPCSERFFSGFSGFPLSSKTNISKFQFDLESEGHRVVSRNRLLSVTLVKQR